jgi:phenylpyruvate tautomerase PptA (4-oxalocrotonate tautomerase family)
MDRHGRWFAIQQIDPANWFVASASLAQHKLGAFWLDIRITDGINTREEKAAFIAAAFAKMNELIGPLHSESYVHVNEVRGDAYGFGGVIQKNAISPASWPLQRRKLRPSSGNCRVTLRIRRRSCAAAAPRFERRKS